MILSSTDLPEPVRHELPGATWLAARVTGSGTAVLMLHGVGTASASFWAQFEEFADTYDVVAWDAFGYGGSSDPSPEPCLDEYADAAAALLDARGHDSAHVVGVSWGGVIATRLALRHPGRVRTLALVSSTYGRKHNAAARAGFGDRIAALQRDGVRVWAQARVDRLVSPQASPELRQRIVETAVTSVRPVGFEAATRTLAETDHRPRLPAVAAPALVLCGDQDPVTGLPESKVLADGIPAAVLRVVPGGGHLVNQDHPAAVNAELRLHWQRFDQGEKA